MRLAGSNSARPAAKAAEVRGAARPNEREWVLESKVSITTARPSGSLLSAATPWTAGEVVLATGAHGDAGGPVGQHEFDLDADGGEVLLDDLGGVLVHAELGGGEHLGLEAGGVAGLGEEGFGAGGVVGPSRAGELLVEDAGVPGAMGTPSSGRPRPKKATLTMSSRFTAWATARRTSGLLKGGRVALNRMSMKAGRPGLRPGAGGGRIRARPWPARGRPRSCRGRRRAGRRCAGSRRGRR